MWHFAIGATCYVQVFIQRNIIFLPSQLWDIVSMFVSLWKALYQQLQLQCPKLILYIRKCKFLFS